MVTYKINGITAKLGAIRTGHDYLLSKFEQPHLRFRIAERGRKAIIKTVEIKKVFDKALSYIDRKCASSKSCNGYFQGLSTRKPITLRKILDDKTIYIYRLKPAKSGITLHQLPAGFCMSWGDAFANIGINELVLSDTMRTAAAILHELAHVAGAPGRREDPKSNAAEKSLIYCGLRKYYDPKALGAIDAYGSPQGWESRLA